MPVAGKSIKDIHQCNHKLLDEICPATFEEMRDNDGLGSDNMTIIIVDLIQNNGGCNGKATKESKMKSSFSSGLGGQKEHKAAGLPSQKLGSK